MINKKMALIMILSFPFGLSCFAQADEIAPRSLPSVNRRAIVCDEWQWIGNGAITWGCLSVPREASVAHGQTTDQVILNLQDQIKKLEAPSLLGP